MAVFLQLKCKIASTLCPHLTKEYPVAILGLVTGELVMSLGPTKGHGNNPPYSPFRKGGESFYPALKGGERRERE